MKEFMMIFRRENEAMPEMSPEQMQASYNQWQDWIGGIAAQGKFVSTNALGNEGKLVNAGGLIYISFKYGSESSAIFSLEIE